MKCGEFASKANHRITIQSMSNTGDAYGGETVSWGTQSTVWAAIMPLSGREVYLQDQSQSRVSTKIIIRYQSALKNTQDTGEYRVSYDGRIFPIKYVRNLSSDMKNEGTQYQELFCEEGYPSEA